MLNGLSPGRHVLKVVPKCDENKMNLKATINIWNGHLRSDYSTAVLVCRIRCYNSCLNWFVPLRKYQTKLYLLALTSEYGSIMYVLDTNLYSKQITCYWEGVGRSYPIILNLARSLSSLYYVILILLAHVGTCFLHFVEWSFLLYTYIESTQGFRHFDFTLVKKMHELWYYIHM